MPALPETAHLFLNSLPALLHDGHAFLGGFLYYLYEDNEHIKTILL